MTDTVIKGNGKSRKLKAPGTMPTTYDAWRTQMISGEGRVDMTLDETECDVVGTPLNKSTLLKDTTATKLGLSSTNQTVDAAIDKLFTYASDGKSKVAAAVTGKGVTTPASSTFEQIAANIGKITTDQTPTITVSSTGLITATCGTKSATKQLPTVSGQTYTPGKTNQTVVSSGKYVTGDQIVKGDTNLIASSILRGRSIFGVAGSANRCPKYHYVINDNISIQSSVNDNNPVNRDVEVSVLLPTKIDTLYSFALNIAVTHDVSSDYFDMIMLMGTAEVSQTQYSGLSSISNPASQMFGQVRYSSSNGDVSLLCTNYGFTFANEYSLVLTFTVLNVTDFDISKSDLLPDIRGFVFYD